MHVFFVFLFKERHNWYSQSQSLAAGAKVTAQQQHLSFHQLRMSFVKHEEAATKLHQSN